MGGPKSELCWLCFKAYTNAPGAGVRSPNYNKVPNSNPNLTVWWDRY